MIMKMLDISTAHITPQTMKRLEEEDDELDLVIYPTPYGAFVHIPVDDLDIIDALPEDLKRVVFYAMGLECDWIKFDGAAEIILELRNYEDKWQHA